MGGFTASIAIVAIAVSSLALTAMFLVASLLSGWYEERARRAGAAMRRGAVLRAGFGAVQGTARPLDGRAGGRLVTSTRTQSLTGGREWRDEVQVTTGDPFVLVVEGGEEIEVDPEDAHPEGLATSQQGLSVVGNVGLRDVVMRLSAGDVIWTTGVLSRREAARAGAYRSGVTRRRLRAPRRGHVEISAESPLPRWHGLAAAHQGGALGAVVCFALLHGLVYRPIDMAAMRRDQAACGSIVGDRAWLPLLVGSGLLAMGLAGAGWRNRVKRARRLPTKSR
jgi:hypothetical protein